MNGLSHARTIAFVVAVTALLSIVAELLGPGANPVWAVSGLVLTIFGTGYALLAVLLPSAEYDEDHVNLLWWSVPSSFIIAILVGAILDSSPLGLSARPYVLILGGTTLGLLGLSLLNGRQRPGGGDADMTSVDVELRHLDATGTRDAEPNYGWRARMQGSAWLLVTVPLVLLASLWAASGILRASRTEPKPFTELFLERPSARSDIPTTWVVVANREARRTEYDLEVRSVDHPPTRWEGISLEASADWRTELTSAMIGTDGEVTATLFLHGSSQSYRGLHVRFSPSEPGGLGVPGMGWLGS